MHLVISVGSLSLAMCAAQESQDAQPMQDLIPYFWNNGAAADGLHNKLSGVFWWAWNSNSGTPLNGATRSCSHASCSN